MYTKTYKDFTELKKYFMNFNRYVREIKNVCTY